MTYECYCSRFAVFSKTSPPSAIYVFDNFIHCSRNFTRRLFDEAIKGLGRFSRHGSRSCRSLSGQNEHVAALVALPFLTTPTDRDHLRNLRCRGGAVHGGMPKCGRSQRLRPFKISSPIISRRFRRNPNVSLPAHPSVVFLKSCPSRLMFIHDVPLHCHPPET